MCIIQRSRSRIRASSVVDDVIKWVKQRHPFFDTPITLSPQSTVADAISLLHKRAHGAVVVVENGKPVGIITEEDCKSVDRFTQLGQGMSKNLTTMPDSLGAREAFDFLNGKINFIELYVKGKGVLGTKRRNCTLLLNKSYDSLRLNYSSNHKRNLKKAHKSNLTVECNVNISQIINLFRLDKGAHLDTLQNQDYENLQSIAIGLESDCYGVYSDGKLICGGLFLKFKDRITFLFSGNTVEGKDKGALFFLLDYLISINANKQMVFDFEGSENDGLRRFYLGFGAELEIYRFIKVNNLKFPFSLLKK